MTQPLLQVVKWNTKKSLRKHLMENNLWYDHKLGGVEGVLGTLD